MNSLGNRPGKIRITLPKPQLDSLQRSVQEEVTLAQEGLMIDLTDLKEEFTFTSYYTKETGSITFKEGEKFCIEWE